MFKEFELVIKIKDEIVYKRESLREIAKPEDLQIEFIINTYDEKSPYEKLNEDKTTKKL